MDETLNAFNKHIKYNTFFKNCTYMRLSVRKHYIHFFLKYISALILPQGHPRQRDPLQLNVRRCCLLHDGLNLLSCCEMFGLKSGLRDVIKTDQIALSKEALREFFLTWVQAHPHFSTQSLRTSRSGNCSDAEPGTAAEGKSPSGCCRPSAAPSRWCSRCTGCTLCLRSLFEGKESLTSEI